MLPLRSATIERQNMHGHSPAAVTPISFTRRQVKLISTDNFEFTHASKIMKLTDLGFLRFLHLIKGSLPPRIHFYIQDGCDYRKRVGDMFSIQIFVQQHRQQITRGFLLCWLQNKSSSTYP